MTKGDKPFKIEISSRTIIFTVFFVLLLKLLWMVKGLIASLFIAFIIMSALKPGVYFLKKRGFPKTIAAFIVFAASLGSFLFLLAWALPPLLIDSAMLLRTMPLSLETINPELSQYINPNSISQYIPNITSQVLGLIGNVFSNTVFILSTLFFSFYFLIEDNFIRDILVRFFEEKDVYRVVNIFNQVEKRMSAWFWGEFVLMTIVGLMTFIGLRLIGIKYAIPLAVIAGLLEAVPNLGPVISAVPAFLVALSQSYFLGFSVLALYFLVQQLENNIIVPIVMKKAVGLSPIITLIALIVGGKIGGVLGVLLAIPVTLFFETILLEIIQTEG